MAGGTAFLAGGRVGVECEITKGLFAFERGVTIKLPGGRVAQTLVDKSTVVSRISPVAETAVKGIVIAHMIRG
ncbi:MAG: hypothetical protein M1528_01265 [Candidatus Marsarchaeota archaeon]|nr:hypothetical protein [Candidatus Marsarchaeota archaeon]